MSLPRVPPVLSLVVIDGQRDPLVRAGPVAGEGFEDGTLFWAERSDRLDCAFLLQPEAPLAATLQAFHVLSVAAADMLSALLPPLVPLSLVWPDRIRLAGADVGRLRCAFAQCADPDEVPDWLALGVQLDVAPRSREPGRTPDCTTLHDEGAGDLTVPQLLESLSRHFVHWVHRWQEEGFAPVRTAWNLRCEGRGFEGALRIGDRSFNGLIEGLDEEGTFRIGHQRLFLEQLLNVVGKDDSVGRSHDRLSG